MHIKTFNDFLFEWDPSMSMDPSAPFNQEDSFSEQNESTLLKAEKLLVKKGHNIPDVFWDALMENDTALEEFDNDLEKIFSKLFEDEYEKGFDKEHDLPIWSDSYNKIRNVVEKSNEYTTAKTTRKKKQIMNNALMENLVNDNTLDIIWPAYEKAIKKLNITESKNLDNTASYKVYHDTYSLAIEEAEEYTTKQGYVLDKEEMSEKIGLGPAKPQSGKTNKFSLTLTKDGKEQKKMLHLQIYNRGTSSNTFELNCYIS